MTQEEDISEEAEQVPAEERAGTDDRTRERMPGHVDDSMPVTVPEDSEDSSWVLPGEGSSEMVGRYKLLQKIGEGGFGVVFMAEQREPIVRRVALKIIKQGMDTRQVIARFEAERQALAMMDHPNIARVLDAGATKPGRPFFVMELVRGMPITRFCDDQKYDLRQRLELFCDICAAVQHAHQKGIIHRDLKPSNILVGLDGDKPVAKIIDFGIAKATRQQLTDKTLFTRFEQFIGTPAYISPEQASLSAVDIDTRSDIYSLGVLLYELLTGRPPFDPATLAAAGMEEMRRIIREKEAPKPSTRLATTADEDLQAIATLRRTEPRKLNLFIKGDLDWVILKALEKERSHRYGTASELRDDLECFLGDQPVTARPPSNLYRFGRFARRNKGSLVAAAIVVSALVGGMTVASWQAFRASRSAERERAQRERAERNELAEALARQEAEASSRRATTALAEVERQRDRALLQAYRVDLANGNLESLDAYPNSMRGWESAFLKAQADQSVRELPGRFVASMSDGRFLAMLVPGEVRIHRAVPSLSSEPMARLPGELGCVSDDGKVLAVSSPNVTVVWSAESRGIIAEIHHHRERAVSGVGGRVSDLGSLSAEQATCSALNASGSRLAVGFGTGEIDVWNVAAQRSLATLQCANGWRVGRLNWIAGGDMLLSASTQAQRMIGEGLLQGALRDSLDGPFGYQKACLWNVQTGRQVQELLEEGEESAKLIVLDPDRSTIALNVFREGPMIRLHDARSGSKAWESSEWPGGRCTELTFGPDGRQLFIGREGNPLALLDVAQGMLATRFPPAPWASRVLAISGDGAFMAAAAANQVNMVGMGGQESGRMCSGHREQVEGGVFVESAPKDGARLLTWSESEMILWRDGRIARRWQPPFSGARSRRFFGSVDLVQTAGVLLTRNAGSDSTHAWDFSEPGESFKFNGWMDFNRVGRVEGGLAHAAGKLYEASSLRVIHDFASGRDLVGQDPCDFSPGGRQLVIVEGAGDVLARVVDCQSRRCLAEIDLGPLLLVDDGRSRELKSVELSRDARHLAVVAGDYELEELVWYDVLTGKRTGALSLYPELKGNGLDRAHFSPDGGRLAVAQADGSVLIASSVSGAVQNRLVGHAGRVCCLVWSSAGDQLVTGAVDETARVWDTAAGECVCVMEAGDSSGDRDAGSGDMQVQRTCISPVGAEVVTASSRWDGSIQFQVWSSLTGERLHTLEAEIGRPPDGFIAFAPDGSRLAVAGEEGVSIYETRSYQKLLSLGRDSDAFFGFATNLAFSGDGRVLFTPFGVLDSVPARERYEAYEKDLGLRTDTTRHDGAESQTERVGAE